MQTGTIDLQDLAQAFVGIAAAAARLQEQGAELWQVSACCRDSQLIRVCWPVSAAALARLLHRVDLLELQLGRPTVPRAAGLMLFVLP